MKDNENLKDIRAKKGENKIKLPTLSILKSLVFKNILSFSLLNLLICWCL
jgi:hypothetical protein